MTQQQPPASGDEWRQWRESIGLTQPEFATAAGVHYSTIQKLERGAPVTSRVLAKIIEGYRLVTTPAPDGPLLVSSTAISEISEDLASMRRAYEQHMADILGRTRDLEAHVRALEDQVRALETELSELRSGA